LKRAIGAKKADTIEMTAPSLAGRELANGLADVDSFGVH
jgi:hypothetical protein